MDANQIPEKYHAVVITKFGQPLEVQELPVPEVSENEVLIRVEAAPINPSDVGFIHGFYPAGKVVPVSPGLEGTGIVVKAGAQVPERYKVGTRVSFFAGATSGTYSQYAKAIWHTLLKLDDDISFEDAASAFVNPVTVIGQFHTAKDAGVKTVVHNAAASALGRQFHKYFKDNGISVINIVRRQEQVDLLKSEGAEIVLNESEEGFKDRLKELAHQHNATILFDPVAGEATATLLEQLPNGSTAYVYGGLGGRAVNNIPVFGLIFQQKTIKGWWLTQYLKEHPVLQTEEFQTSLNGLLKGSLKTVYAKQYGLHEIKEALEYYSKNQTGGKVLVRPFKQ